MNTTSLIGQVSSPLSNLASESISKSLGVGGEGASALSGAASAGIAAAIALPIAIGMSMLAQHDKRVQAAKTESGAIAQAISTFDADLNQIFQALNSGQISADQGIQALEVLDQSFWKFIGPYQQAQAAPCAPLHRNAQGGYCYQSTPCNSNDKGKTCTSGCCVGCNVIDAVVTRAIEIISAGAPATLNVCQIFDSGFGYKGRAGYTLSYNPPSISTSISGRIDQLLYGVAPTLGSSGQVGQVVAGIQNTWLYIALGFVALLLGVTFLGKGK